MKIRVVVADDFPLVREGVVRALNQDPGIEVVAQAENAVCASEAAGSALRPRTARKHSPSQPTSSRTS